MDLKCLLWFWLLSSTCRIIEGYVLSKKDDDSLESGGQKSCVCVPYWQCKEDFSGLVEDGVDIIDIRVVREASGDRPANTCTGDFDVCCEIECGKLNNGLLGSRGDGGLGYRIFGGNNDASFAEFPWMLGMLEEKVFKCGASLIHPQVAMTAAHCVAGSKRGKFKVRAGEWNWAKQDEPLGHQDRMTKKIIIHPQFDPGTLQNDIALLIVDEPFRLSENVGVVCVPTQNSRLNANRCIATGWGKNSSKRGTYQSVLKKVELPLVPRPKCQSRLRDLLLGPGFTLHRSFICAGGLQRKDACKGDGGSPLICPIAGEVDRYEQSGIVSWGLTCGVHDSPGVYVNVAMFSDWIDSQMSLHHFDTFIYRSS